MKNCTNIHYYLHARPCPVVYVVYEGSSTSYLVGLDVAHGGAVLLHHLLHPLLVVGERVLLVKHRELRDRGLFDA